MIMNAKKFSSHHSINIVMQSSGVVWQCILLRRRLGFHVIVSLINRYDDTTKTIERSFLEPSGFITDPEGWPAIDKSAFRLKKSSDKHGTFLSGFIEEKNKSSLQWDIQLSNLFEENTEQKKYHAQGRIMLEGQEVLFPLASTHLILDHDVSKTID